MDFQERMKKRLAQEFAAGAGEEVVGVRELRGKARRALDGDLEAQNELVELAMQNGHQQGEEMPCAVCRQVNVVLNEMAGEGAAIEEVPSGS